MSSQNLTDYFVYGDLPVFNVACRRYALYRVPSSYYQAASQNYIRKRPIVTNGVAWSVGLSVRLSRLSALQKRLNRSRCRLEYGLGWAQGSITRWSVRWSNLTNTTEPSMRCGDAAFCQIITLTTCYYRRHQ